MPTWQDNFKVTAVMPGSKQHPHILCLSPLRRDAVAEARTTKVPNSWLLHFRSLGPGHQQRIWINMEFELFPIPSSTTPYPHARESHPD